MLVKFFKQKGISNKGVAEVCISKYSSSIYFPGIVSTLVKNKEKLLASLEKKGTNSKSQKLRSEDLKKKR